MWPLLLLAVLATQSKGGGKTVRANVSASALQAAAARKAAAAPKPKPAPSTADEIKSAVSDVEGAVKAGESIYNVLSDLF